MIQLIFVRFGAVAKDEAGRDKSFEPGKWYKTISLGDYSYDLLVSGLLEKIVTCWPAPDYPTSLNLAIELDVDLAYCSKQVRIDTLESLRRPFIGALETGLFETKDIPVGSRIEIERMTFIELRKAS